MSKRPSILKVKTGDTTEEKETTPKPSPQVVVQVPEDQHDSRDSLDSPTDLNTGITNSTVNFTRSFSWNKEDEAEKPLLSSDEGRCARCGECFHKWPYFLRCLVYSFIGCAIIMIPGLIDFFFYVDDVNVYFKFMKPKDGQFAIDGIPFFVFAVFLCIIWCAFFGLRWAFTVLPDILIRISEVFLGTTANAEDGIQTGSKIAFYMDYMRFLKHELAFLVWTIVGFTTWAFIFLVNPAVSAFSAANSNWQNVILLIWLNLLFASLVWCIEKALLQVFSVQFHKRAYSDRIEQNKKMMKILERLSKARDRRKSSPMSKLGTVADTTAISANADFESVLMTDKTGRIVKEIGSKAADVSKNIFFGLGQVFGAAVGIDVGYSTGIVLRTPQDARKLAKKLFEALCSGNGEFIIPEDFEPYFPTKEDAKAAFFIFDVDKNGDISKTEMKSILLNAFREKVSIEKALRSSSQAIGKLDNILKALVFFIVLFISLGIWNVNITTLLTTLVTIWAGLLFAIGGTIKNLVESCIFLFLTHPYDVGDRVDIDEVSYIVKEFGLTSTVFQRGDGKEIYAPNAVLASKFIHNVRRSGNQGEDIKMLISLDTPTEKIHKLREFLFAFVSENSRDYMPKLEISIKDVIDRNSMLVSMTLEHKGNWQDGGKRAMRRNKFMFALKDGIHKFEIRLPNAQELNVKLLSHPDINLSAIHSTSHIFE